MLAVHKVNVLGPMMVTQALLPLLRKGSKKVVQPLDSPMPVRTPFYTICRQCLPGQVADMT